MSEKSVNPGTSENISSGLVNNNINNTNPVSNNTPSKRGNINNLAQYKDGWSAERARELASHGGKASQEAHKRRKTFQEQARALLDMRCSQESAQNVLGDDAQRFFPDGQATNGEILLARMMLEGWQGNTKAAEFTRDTAGYKPTQEISVEGMDDAARALLANVAKRLEQADKKSKKD